MTSGCKLITPFEDYRMYKTINMGMSLHDRFKRQLNLINMYGCMSRMQEHKILEAYYERVREHANMQGSV